MTPDQSRFLGQWCNRHESDRAAIQAAYPAWDSMPEHVRKAFDKRKVRHLRRVK